jgi:predicted RNase H-like HicB family nuclease
MMRIELEREEDGRWLAEIPELPGVMAYSTSREGAVAKVEAHALRIMAERLENNEAIPELDSMFALHA